MSKDKPLVSVLITTCDRPDYLDRCLLSVLSQDFKNYEILIMDDNSDAQTEAVIKKYKPLFNIGANYRHIRNEPRLGYQKSLNRGLREARGDYIARLDDDDAWADVDKLSRQIEFLDTHPEYVLVGTGVIVVDENGTELRRSFLPEHDDEIREMMLEQNCFIHSSVVYRKSSALDIGGYHEDKYPYSEDYDLWVKLGTVGKLANLPIYGVRYTSVNRGVAFTLKLRVIPAVRSIKLIGKYKDKYPNYWLAVSLRPIRILNCLLHIISNIPPFINLKRFLKSKCPACWRAIAFSHRIIFQSIIGILRLLTGHRNRRLDRTHFGE